MTEKQGNGNAMELDLEVPAKMAQKKMAIALMPKKDKDTPANHKAETVNTNATEPVNTEAHA